MRYILFLFLSFFAFQLSAQEVSDIMVTYAKKDASLEQIFSDLESQYGIRFSYATTAIEDKIMDAEFENESIEDVLDYLLADELMEYKIVSNNVLVRKSDSFEELKSDDYNSSLHIKGKITNSHDTKEGLDYATITVSNTSIGTYSDSEGRFDIEIPEGHLNENIIIHYLGYEDEVYKISELDDEFIMVALKDGQFSIDEIMIVNKEKPLRFGDINNSIQLNGSQISSSTSGLMGNDIGRQIQLLPGIAAHDDDSAAIKIRGSNSDETLMILDGMPIYNANHYYGIFSGVNTAYIDSVNIFKNSYPLQYGGKTAGLVELFSNNAQPTKTKANLNLDFLTASGDIHTPISKNSFISVAGRSTINKVNNKQFNTIKTPTQINPQVQSFSEKVADRKNDPSFTFYDLNAKYQYRSSNNDVFSINLFRSADNVSNSYQTSIIDNGNNEVNLNAKDNQSWSNTAASLIYSKSLSSDFKLNSTAYLTHYSNEEITEFKLDKKFKKGGPFQPINDTLIIDIGSEQKNKLMDVSIDSHLDYKYGNQSIKLGISGINHEMDYQFADNNNDKLIGKENFLELSGYVGHNIQLLDKLYLNSGLRATYFTNIKEIQYSPRFLLNYQASDRLSFKASYSIENQVIRQFDYEYRGEPKELWVSSGLNEIPVLRSQNFMIGSTLKMKYFSIDVELYQKDMKGLLEYLIPNPAESSNNAEQIRDYKLFKGDGQMRGIDIILSSGFKNYDTYLSYTLSKSEQRFKEIFNNQFFASENDRPHQFKWVNTLTTGNFTWGLNSIYVSGRPYTDIRNISTNGDIRNIDPDNRIRRVKPYRRVDISAAYAFKIGNFDASLTATVFNLMNTKNLKYIQSVSTDTNAGQTEQNIIIGNESELLNRTFNLGFRVGF